jgi:hypothetical protein
MEFGLSEQQSLQRLALREMLRRAYPVEYARRASLASTPLRSCSGWLVTPPSGSKGWRVSA